MNWLREHLLGGAKSEEKVQRHGGHPGRQRFSVVTIIVFLVALSARAAESQPQPEAERVGELGRKEAIVFEGMSTFSGSRILSTLQMRLEFCSRSDPEAPLADYLGWLKQLIEQGYRYSGFARATVNIKADRQAGSIRVSVVEGPRFTCGAVKITGLERELSERLDQRLQQAATLRDSARVPGQPSFFWPWREGEPALSDPVSLANLEKSGVAALAELNQHGAQVQTDLALDETRHVAELLLQVKNPGAVGTLEQIEVEGLWVNSREDLLSFLQLRPGVALSGNVTNDTLQRLYASGRFSAYSASLSQLAQPGRYKLGLAVMEFTNAPPLKQELTREEKAFLNLRQWVLNWTNRPEDWRLEATATRKGRPVQLELVLGQEGLGILLRRSSSATNPPALEYALIASPQHVGFYSGPQQSKLIGKPSGGWLEVSVGIEGDPSHDQARCNFKFGAVWHTGPHGAPYSIRLDLAPVAFIAGAHPRDGSCRFENGILSVRTEPGEDPAWEMTIEAATGRLIRSQFTSSTDGFGIALRSEEGAFPRLLREVAAESASFTNALDPQHPWASSLTMLGGNLRQILAQSFPEVLEWLAQKTEGAPSVPEVLEVATMFGELPWRELLLPLDSFSGKPSNTDHGEDFPFVLEGPVPSLQAGSDWLQLLGGALLRLNDDLWPRGSWPWSVLRNATFLAAGEARWATNSISHLVEAETLGPLGCLAAARVLGRFDPRLTMAFARLGASRATPSAIQDDLRLLLRGDKVGPQFLQGALRRVPAFTEQNLRTCMKLIGTNSLPLALECVAAVKTNPSLPLDEALHPIIERHWEREIRPWLLMAFANDWLQGCQISSTAPAPAQAAEVAGWVRQAAQQGHAPAQMLLGRFYAGGMGVTTDPEAAATWFKRAVEQDYPHAACELGRLYVAQGQGDEAARWFRIGLRDGCSSAEIGLARHLLGATGATPAQQEEGLGLLRKAAEGGAPQAYMDLAVFYETHGKPEDALESYRQAAVRGVVEAMAKLGDYLSDATRGKPDDIEAWAWLKLAASRGHRISAANARFVERRLTAEQLAQARRTFTEFASLPGISDK